ncbi:unnamed protein product [Trypanosoma congolense IL3000]|uniref:WGS project CAEQ00000000 data, annotated contig 1802 n=1 Tax=Trypanosoma congolense (strain IL3000) TaxID=1068625 RepID=F9W8Z1_TRYCI|nr:unnamed protein product [Trypanosoma congolense IL3000]
MCKVNYCLGGGGRPARRRDLLDCFQEGKKLEIGEANLAKIPESTTHNYEPYLTAIMKDVKHSSLASYFNRKYGGDGESDCNMINGSGGILNSALHDKLWWGGGVLTIGKGFTGFLSGKENFIAGEIKDAKEANKAFWTASPTTVPHLNKTLTAFQDFKDAAATITQKFTEIENIEKQIEPCLSNETMEEGHTQSCFKSSVKLNAELQAANALLARYHKEKGPLPSGSALIPHQRLVNVWYLFASLL